MKRIFHYAAAAVIIPFMAACTETDETVSSLSATPASVTIPAEGGTVNVVINTDASSFEYSGQAEWLEVTLDGKAMNLSAEANPDQTQRDCNISVTAGSRTISIPVTQEASSKYPGYAMVSSFDAESSYYQGLIPFFGPADQNGGQTYLLFVIDSRTTLQVECFTKLFQSASEVELSEGEYTPGEDLKEDGMSYVGQAMTFVPGLIRELDDEEDIEIIPVGTFTTTTLNGTETYKAVTGGSMTVTANDEGTVTVLMDFTAADGTALKYYYEGELELSSANASFPGVEILPTDVISVSGTYNGANEGYADYCNIELTLNTAGSPYPTTFINFNVPYTAFADDIDLSGTYNAIDAPFSAAGINKGTTPAPGPFSFPTGTYVYLDLDMTTFTGEYFVADGASTMTLTKNDDGTYDIAATLANAAGESYEYDIKGMNIELYDDTATGDLEDEEW